MERYGVTASWRSVPPLDLDYYPIEQFRRAFLTGADRAVAIAVEGGGRTTVYRTCIRRQPSRADQYYVNLVAKTLLWLRGGCRILTDDETVYGWLRETYGPGGERTFDASFMARTYDEPFTVERVGELPPDRDGTVSTAGGLDGCRIGFDAGGSDRKAVAVRDGEVVYAEEVVWNPKDHADLAYHEREVRAALKSAAAHLPRVDAVGISSAGIQIGDRTGTASLFIRAPAEEFRSRGRDLYLRAVKDVFGAVPCRVINDGDAAALSGALTLGQGDLLGIAMGTSQAGGFVDGTMGITGWLNELAFVPVDVSAGAPRDGWSGDVGCGGSYFSQEGVLRLAERAGLALGGDTPAERLRAVQRHMARGDERAAAVYETLGIWLGHALAYYEHFYGCRHVLLLGRVMSGPGGDAALDACRRTLASDYPELELALRLPTEETRRLGQAVAAAALPVIEK